MLRQVTHQHKPAEGKVAAGREDLKTFILIKSPPTSLALHRLLGGMFLIK